MSNRKPEPQGRVWTWLTPSVVLLGAMAVWGAMRYPQLPERVPMHIGADGVDAWTAKSVWTAFVPVLVYAGLTAVLAGCAALAARTMPLDAMPAPRGGRHPAVSVLTNRPATTASARRTARALLIMNAVYGAALLPLCEIQWRTTATAGVSPWAVTGSLALFLLGLVPVGAAWWRDTAEKRAVTSG